MKQVYAVSQYSLEPLLAFERREDAIEFSKRLNNFDKEADERAEDYVFALPLVTE